MPSYLLADARVTLQGERWSVGVFVDNLADKRAVLNNVTSLSVNLESYNRVATNQPRTFRVRFTLSN